MVFERMNWKEILLNKKILILIILLIISLIAIRPFPQDGVSIRSVAKNSPASSQINVGEGKPMSYERVIAIDNQKISSVAEYYDYLEQIGSNTTVRLETNKEVYRVSTDEYGDLGLQVVDAPSSNVKKGLDLEGGTRVFLQPEEEVDDETMEEAVASLKVRLNAFGLSNVVVRKIKTPQQFIVVELAGATPQEVKDLLLQQGKFEAKISNQTVIRGPDVKYVGSGAQNARITQCGRSESGYTCGFQFSLTISQEAAQKFANVTSGLTVNAGSLSENIFFYLDNEELSNLSISSSLKGQAQQQISITGGESGDSEREARDNTHSEMRRLQTILKSGSLPVKLSIAQSETLSPVLGKEFTRNAIFVGVAAILAVALIIFIAYRKIRIVIPTIIAMTSEIFIILGIAALIQWQLDLAAIAGIIIAAGTGVDDQIVIISEIMKGEVVTYNWKEKIKKAFFIIMGSYLTTVVATIPLAWAGAGLLKGFAFATIVGVSIGVFITRPAFAVLLEKIIK
jgi:preprotein translocase subunit SecD